jgi:2-oxoglutarate-Fe(II)-dependent oxygenase superfamily protein
MRPGFCWTTFDLTIPLRKYSPDWHRDIVATAADADVHEYPRTPILSREAADVLYIRRGRLEAGEVQKALPWLHEMYRNDFLELARIAWGDETVEPARDDRIGVVLNVQRGTTMRFECHVDSNPLSGLLFCTDHQEGGELVFAHDKDAADVDAVEQDCSVIRPHKGHLIFFDGREYPHYARPLMSESETRVVAVMNYYSASWPESTRPPELNQHRFGDA